MSEYLANAIGESVFHEGLVHRCGLGHGVICAFSTGSNGTLLVEVRFDSKPDVISRFPFPAIFTGKHRMLTTNSIFVKKAIERAICEKTCSVCGVYSDVVQKYVDSMLCTQCAKELDSCCHCHTALHPNAAAITYKSTFPGDPTLYVCRECASKYVTCQNCGKQFYLPNRFKYYPKVPPELQWCSTCIEDNGFECSSCENIWLYSELTRVENYNLCPDCVKTNSIICRECGQRAVINRVVKPFRTIDGLCMHCESKEHYRLYVFDIVNEILRGALSTHRITYETLRKNRHEQLMNRLSMCWQPFVDILLIDFGIKSLILSYGSSTSLFVHEYFRHNTSGTMSMSDFKKQSDYHWLNFFSQQRFWEYPHKNCKEIRLWKEPFRIKAKTERVSHYYKIYRNGYLEEEGNNYGDTEFFYIIGLISW